MAPSTQDKVLRYSEKTNGLQAGKDIDYVHEREVRCQPWQKARQEASWWS
jgi:hypothetical protein